MQQVLLDTTDCHCFFNEERTHRFELWRIWDNSKPFAMFIGLNPSTADEKALDPTCSKCVHYCREWGFGGYLMMNLFSFRATDPKDMKKAEKQNIMLNDIRIARRASEAGIIILAWGNHGTFHGRANHVLHLLKPFSEKLHCLKLSKHGNPVHPLYLKNNLKPIKWKL
jgi:hypothetical protein